MLLTYPNIKKYLPILIFYVIAVTIKLYRNAPPYSYLLAGSDGPYFPLQVKYLIEHGRLAYPDMPLLFWLGAGVAKVLQWVGCGSLDQSILYAVKAIDTLWPPLAVIPVYGIARLVSKNANLSRAAYIVIGFTILNITPLFIFSGQLQKNSFAMIWVMAYFYSIMAWMKDGRYSHLLLALMTMLLCALTHIGSFGMLLAFSAIAFFIKIWYADKRAMLYNKAFWWIAQMPVIFAALIYVIDETRFYKLIYAPFKLFEAPVLLHILQGQNFLLHGSTLISLLANNILAIVCIYLLYKNRSVIATYLYLISISCAMLTLLMASPMLGLEWANRLYMMAFVPIAIAYLILFAALDLGRWHRPVIFIFGTLLLMSFVFSLGQKQVYSIDVSSFDAFKKMIPYLQLQKNDAVVARQDLRLLAHWMTECKGLPDYRLAKNNFGQYPHVYFIKQIKGRNPSIRGEEKSCIGHCNFIFSDNHFEAYNIVDTVGLQSVPQTIFKGVRGNVEEIRDDYIVVKNDKTGIYRKVNTQYVKSAIINIKVGQSIVVNGEWMPFSLTIKAKNISTHQ